MASAQAFEITKISDSLLNSDLPITYNRNGLKVSNGTEQEIASRASQRLSFIEIRKQQIIDAIVLEAYKKLEQINFVSSDPVDAGWISRFFNSVDHVDGDEMKSLWGNILAGEIVQPNSYSLRALDILKNMTAHDISALRHISTCVLTVCGRTPKKIVLISEDLLRKYNICVSNILLLRECGIIASEDLAYELPNASDDISYIHNSKVMAVIRPYYDLGQRQFLSVYAFTSAGIALLETITDDINDNYIFDVLHFIKASTIDLAITAHEITKLTESAVEYAKDDIFH
ncbi:DUF2806 domain-containing protein [Anaerobiospirillum succiniciproducens]|uniref:DUF2806 domain-containing protein n=1 Tax=Anaerobiospirillum succiniciproducens TaxID=13335 RepID=UPI0003FCD6CC|nr:DUF2806 domain-containing protein [Anaerobiospirillum succiniciproducens]